MAGYNARQSSYSDGDVITAAQTNDEFDAIVAAFNAATGHAHDGTAGEGPVIALIGDAGSGTPLNKIQIDTVNDQIGFFLDVAGSSVEQVRLADGALLPVVDGDIDLGSSGLRFKNTFTDNLTVTTAISSGTLSLTGNLSVGGTVDGRDVAADGTKLDGIEANADVTDFANVQAAGALMDNELASIGSVKALNQNVATTATPTFRGINLSNTFPFIDIMESDTSNVNTRITNSSGILNIQTINDAKNSTTTRLTLDHTSGDFAYKTDLIFGDWSADRVGINSSVPAHTLDVNGTFRELGGFYSSGNIYFNSSGTSGDYLSYATRDGLSYFENGVGPSWRLPGAETATTVGWIGSSENSGQSFGFGTNSPQYRLDVRDHTVSDVLRVVGNTQGRIVFGDQGTPKLWTIGSNASDEFSLFDVVNNKGLLQIEQNTGDATFQGNVVAGQSGVGAVGLTTNDGSGNANVTFNHTDGVADSSGSSARITSDVDSTTASLEFQLKDNVSAGAQTLTEYFAIRTSGVSVSTDFQVDGSTFFVDSSSNHVGVGITTPSRAMHIYDSSAAEVLRLTGDTACYVEFGDVADNTIWSVGTDSGGDFVVLNSNNSFVSSFRVDSLAPSNSLRINATEVQVGGAMDFSVDGSTLFVDASSNRVGINTTSPSATLDVNGDLRVGGRRIYFDTNTTSGDYLRHITTEGLYWYENGTVQGRLGTGTAASRFFTDVQIGGLTNGNLASGTNDGGFLTPLNGGNYSTTNTSSMSLRRQGTDGNIMVFRKNTTQVGSINVTDTNTTYNTSSDERLKKNIVDATKDSGNDVDSIRVREFDWKVNGEHQEYGFIAQELEEVAPYAVSTDDSEEGMKSVDYSKLVPLMMKELQELRKRVAELESSK